MASSKFLVLLLAGLSLVFAIPVIDESIIENFDCNSSSFAEQILANINIHRANHSAPDLTWDPSLASDAQTLTNSCVFAHQMNIGAGNYGQNIGAIGPPSDLNNVVDSWYNDEMENWHWYGQDITGPLPPNFDSYAHFTALVWKASTHVGCAYTTCPPDTIFPGFNSQVDFIACNFFPEGNDFQFTADNVLPPLGYPYVKVIC